MVRGCGTEVRKSPHGGAGGSREVLRLNGKERSPRETDTGAPGRGAGEPWGGCRLAEGKQACGLLSQAGMGPLVAGGEEVMPGCPQGGGGHREQLVLWGWVPV